MKQDKRDGTWHHKGWMIEPVEKNGKVKVYNLYKPGWRLDEPAPEPIEWTAPSLTAAEVFIDAASERKKSFRDWVSKN